MAHCAFYEPLDEPEGGGHLMDISGTGIKHITMFDRQYTPEKQAEDWQSLRPSCLGIVTSAPFATMLDTGAEFTFPAVAWCMHRKAEILADMQKEDT